MSDTELSTIRILAKRQVELQSEIDRELDVVKSLQKRLDDICFNQLPDAMDSYGVAEVKTEDGLTVKIEDYFTASASKRNFPAVLEHLERLNSMDIVKHEVIVPMTADESDKIEPLIAQLAELGHEARDKMDINTGTLKAFVKEQLNQNNLGPDDLSTFGVFEQRRAKITEGK